jgi:non-ribosomal peptide synthetase component F
MVGCETLPRYLLQQWQHFDVAVVGVFGLTETTITTTVWQVNENDLADYQVMPIGRPIANTQVYVLDRAMQVLPIGVVGEMYIGGAGVAKGYINRPELTSERFVANPFYDETDSASSERLYRTGDLVRWLSDGQLEFLGRNDAQVKVRGFRIELGEIEGVLMSCPGVCEALVDACAGADGNKMLVGYYRAEGLVNEAQLRTILKAQLPDILDVVATLSIDIEWQDRS